MGAVAIGVAVGLSGGCSVRTGLGAVDALVPPGRFHQAQRLGDFVDERWWEAFDDTTLNRLMTEVFDRNLSLQAALARFDQYSALARTANANRLPPLLANRMREAAIITHPAIETPAAGATYCQATTAR